MKSMVVGYDGSEDAERALERALALAKDGSSLVVVSAARLASRGSGVDPIEAEFARKSLDKARALLVERGVEARTVEGHGDPADVLVQQAKDDSAELILVGTRGLGVAKRALLGSVSTKVVHHAPCDVLVVR